MTQPLDITPDFLNSPECDQIFEKLHNDEELAKQLQNIEDNKDFTPRKKKLFIEYRIGVAFAKYYDEIMSKII